MDTMRRVDIGGNLFYNGDCVEGMRSCVEEDSVDLVVTDPPYGIEGDKLHRHYHRDERFVVDGYVEVPCERYGDFSHKWVKEAARVLRPGGQMYIVSGYTNLYHILDALRTSGMREINHIIWKYNFGVYTTRKYISSHYHILYYEKSGGRKAMRTFNHTCIYGPTEKGADGSSLNYRDREDVWSINKEYKPGREKNKNELPAALLMKMMLYSSDEGDVVCDPFMGGFSTARVAIGLNRRFTGFEISERIFSKKLDEMGSVVPGGLLKDVRRPKGEAPPNQRKKWSDAERKDLARRYRRMRRDGRSKNEAMKELSKEFGRGRFAILNALDREGL
jgi:site-specific DNA-methyltransferase (adenine-specific)